MSKISVYIITYNEANKIMPAIRSVIGWADEVLVIDSQSTDGTIELAKNAGARVEQVVFKGFGDLRNQALKYCQYDWIFSLDADERCTPEAEAEILGIVRQSRENSPCAYFTPRRNYLLGREVKHSGWYPDYRQPQLFKNGALSYGNEPVHETYKTTGPVGYMKNAIIQVPFENLAQMLHKANRYSTLGAEKLLTQGRRGGFWRGLLSGVVIFLKLYILQLGLLDGRAGFAIALSGFVGAFYKYAKRAEMDIPKTEFLGS